MDITTQKIFIGEDNKAAIICKQCGADKYLTLSPAKHYGKQFKVKCVCGYTFNVLFEPRRSYRKDTQLFGVCYRHGSNEILSDISINNISKKGIGFTIDSKAIQTDSFKKGDILRIEFRLDNASRTGIRTKIIVQAIIGKTIGAEFYAPDENTLKEIGFYLLP